MADVTAKLAEVVRLMLDHFCNPAITRHDFKLRDQAREALAAYEQAQAEPVAWMVKDKDGRTFIFRTRMPVVSEGETLTPLFAAPVAQAATPAPAPAPLTEDEWRARDSSDTDEGCAALHRAHGIGKEASNG